MKGLQFYLPLNIIVQIQVELNFLQVIADQVNPPHAIDSVKASLSNTSPTIKIAKTC